MKKLFGSLLFLILVAGACQTTTPDPGVETGKPDYVAMDEIGKIEDTSVLTAKQAIRRLRPQWLRPRAVSIGGPQTPAVFQDGVPMGGLEVLEDLDVKDLQELRFLSSSDATNRYGTGYPGGIIMVMTRRGG